MARDVVQTVAAMVIHAHAIALPGVSMTWKSTCDLKKTVLLHFETLFQDFIINQIHFKNGKQMPRCASLKTWNHLEKTHSTAQVQDSKMVTFRKGPLHG